MRSVFRLSLMALAFLLVLSARGQDDKKAEKKDKITLAGQIAGRVAAVDSAQKSITVEVRRGKGSQNVTWQTIDDVKIRLRNPRPAYDDKGKVRKPTAKDLKEQKGKDTKLPGYEAGWDDLKVNEIVSVNLGIKKGDKNPVATLIMIEKTPN